MENNENNEALKSANNSVDTQNQTLDYEKEYNALMEKYNSLNNDYMKKSQANDKLSSENAEWKRKYNSTLSDVEKEKIAQEEREKHYKEIERQFNLGNLKNSLSKTINNDEVSSTIAGYMLDGNFNGAVEEMNKYFANHDEELSKQMTEKLLKNTPTPPPQNVNDNGGVTKEKLDKMSYNERVEFKNKNPELYEKLTK